MTASYRLIERGGLRDVLGEGLLWSPRQNAVYWTDILAPAVNRLSLDDNSVTRWPMPEPVGWVIERESGAGFIAGFMSGFAELTLDPVTITPIVNPHPDMPDNRLNDAKADAEGRIWAGSMPFHLDRPSGKLYRLDPDRSLHVMDSGYTVANGPAISPDQRWLYHTDTVPGLIYRFALGKDGSLGQREIFIRFDKDWGRPDGMTVDAEGHLWVAHWNGAQISRFTPDGKRIRSIPLPARQITNICFAGQGLERMFVTSAHEGSLPSPNGGMFEILDPGVTGIAPGRFGG